MIFPMIHQHEFYGYSHSEHTGTKYPMLQQYMKADVRIIVSNKTLWQQVLG